MVTLQEKFRGCLLGAAMGDIIGAVVEAESASYIASTFRTVDEILSVEIVPEFAGPAWQVGRYTDDTQMLLCVAEWLIQDRSHSPETLLARFSAAHEAWRRYGSGTEAILRLYSQHPAQWRELSTVMFPFGSYGNGSAMRVAPVGLVFANNIEQAIKVAMASSRPTHSHSLAYQGAVLQTIAVATALTCNDFSPEQYLRPMRVALKTFSELLQDISAFERALDSIERGLAVGSSCMEQSAILGTGITAQEAVPMAIYCFLSHPDSYEQVIHETVFIGGDTDTIACMAGAISGAYLGNGAIPPRWIQRIQEPKYSASVIENLADDLLDECGDAT